MSEYLDQSELHMTGEGVTLRWTYEEINYGVQMPHELFELLRLAEGDEPYTVMKVGKQNEG